MSTAPDIKEHADAVGARALRKVTWRLMPVLIAGYFVSYVDRINISFAKFGLTESFGLSATGFGFAAGIFFVGYILFEVPSNLVQHRVGARIWLSRIMLTWGVIAAATAFVNSAATLYAARFLLGAAEAGFFPGIIVFLARWYPDRERTRMIAVLMMAIPLSSALAGPFNGWILSTFEGTLGLEAWRWVFIVGGLPAVALAFVFFFTVADSPAKAPWLTSAERDWLDRTLAAEEAERREAAPLGHWEVFRSGRVLTLCLIYFLLQCGAYPLVYWMPSVIDELGDFSKTELGFVTAVPFAFAAVGMYVAGRKASRHSRSAMPVILALAVSFVAFIATALSLKAAALAFVMITIATVAAQTAKPLFWSLPTAYLSGAAAATGIALINSMGNAAGFVSPFAVGWIQDATGGNVGVSMSVMIAADALALITVVILALRSRGERTAQPSPKAAAPVKDTVS
ncbi:MFS transporter [Streptomyces cucumeris]|uniref:MFS transporter n=1 Tax=Streptomyces cucumeris TaxID=2962890 RepID=UPI003EC0D318